MAINFTATSEGNLLIINASGFDDNLEEVQQYGMAVIEACSKYNVTRVLCDETNLEYRLSVIGTFQSVEFIAAQVPAIAKVALVCSEKSIADAAFWETVAVNRGLLRVFSRKSKRRGIG